MNRILFLTAFAALIIMNTTISSAKEFVDNSKRIVLTTIKDDTRHIGKEKDIEPDTNGPARSIILQPVYAYHNNKIVNLDFTDTLSMVNIIIINNTTGETIYSEMYSNPTTLNINLNDKSSGSYFIEIRTDDMCLEGVFIL